MSKKSKLPAEVRGLLKMLARGKAVQLLRGEYKLSEIRKSKQYAYGHTAQCSALVLVVNKDPRMVYEDKDGVRHYYHFWQNCSRWVGTGPIDGTEDAPFLCWQHQKRWDHEMRITDMWTRNYEGVTYPMELEGEVSQSFWSEETEAESLETYRKLFGFTPEDLEGDTDV